MPPERAASELASLAEPDKAYQIAQPIAIGFEPDQKTEPPVRLFNAASFLDHYQEPKKRHA